MSQIQSLKIQQAAEWYEQMTNELHQEKLSTILGHPILQKDVFIFIRSTSVLLTSLAFKTICHYRLCIHDIKILFVFLISPVHPVYTGNPPLSLSCVYLTP
jgi:hypothetical protein